MTTTTQVLADYPRCGALKRSSEGTCGQAAGWSTNHPGTGRCKLHGGTSPSHIIKNQREVAALASATYGLPREVEPGQALLEEVHRTAGHVAWLEVLIGGKTPTELVQLDGQLRLGPSVWVELYQAERKHLAAVSKSAIDAGIDERRVRLEEDQGRLLAAGLVWLLGQLGLEKDERARNLVGSMLRSLATGTVPIA